MPAIPYTEIRQAKFVEKGDVIDLGGNHTQLILDKDIRRGKVTFRIMDVHTGRLRDETFDHDDDQVRVVIPRGADSNPVFPLKLDPFAVAPKVENPSEPAADKSDDQKLVDHLYQRGEHEAAKRLAKLTGVVSFHDDWTLLSALHKDGSELSSAARSRILNLKTLLHQIHLSAVHGDNVKWIEELVRAELEKH